MKFKTRWVISRVWVALDFLTETGYLHAKPSIYFYPKRRD
jgi:hypothetical protein